MHRAGAVDSVTPWDVALAAFRADLPLVRGLDGGATSLEALVDSFLVRVARADTAGLVALTMSRAEFGWLYYPTLPEAHPPYDLSPALMWFTAQGPGRRGLTTLLALRASGRLEIVDWSCPAARVYGENSVYTPCTVRRALPGGDTLRERLFGAIVERDGRFKFLNLSNSL